MTPKGKGVFVSLGDSVSYSSPSRRRSFHDLSSLRDMRVLKIEQMQVDVELCGQLLIMARREEHLQNVLACLEVNTFLSLSFKASSTTGPHEVPV